MVYCGKINPLSSFGHTETVFLKLMVKLLDRDHALYVDNFYASVPLAKTLLNQKTLICVTLRKNRKDLPKNIVFTKLKKDSTLKNKKSVLL